jgi:hypothetical protein
VKFHEHLVLELIVRFELSVMKGEFNGVLQASTGSSERLNINFFRSHHLAH